MPLQLLKELQENISTSNNEIWRACVAWDGSGELLLDETPIIVFDTQKELKTYVNELVEHCDKPLTHSLICDILKGVRK